jgi:hypothetical protein
MTTMSSSAPEVQQVYARARQLAKDMGKLVELFTTIWGSWLVVLTSGDSAALRRFDDELSNIAHGQHDCPEPSRGLAYGVCSSAIFGGCTSMSRRV